MKIVVFDDGETWAPVETSTICDVPDELVEKLEEGDYPKHLELVHTPLAPHNVPLTEDVTNKDRAVWARKALEEFRRQVGHDTSGDDMATSVMDFLVDLRHMCDEDGIDFFTEVKLSGRHYEEEKSEEHNG